MNWELAGIIAEIVGAAAVVITLVFLAVEIRTNRNATESASIDALAAGFNNINLHITGDAEFFRVFLAALADPIGLDEADRARFLWTMQSYINHLTSVKKYHDAGSLSEEEWQAYGEGCSQVFNTPGGNWALENVAVTPSLLTEMRKFQGTEIKKGFLGINNDV